MFIEYIEGGKYIEKSGGKYTCEYIHNSGEVCGRGCRRPEGCYEHWRSKKRVLCDDCGKPTASACGRCKKHSKGYYVMQFYARQLQMLEDHP